MTRLTLKTGIKYYFTIALAVFFLFAANGFSVVAACCAKCGDEQEAACHHDEDSRSHEHACHYYFLKTDETENYINNYSFNKLPNVLSFDSCGLHSFICFYCVEKVFSTFDTHFSPVPILEQSCVLLC